MYFGEKSYGKYCGAGLLTPKDASGKDDLEISNWLLTLVIYKLVNTQGFTEYKDGIAPDYEVADSGLMSGIPLGSPEDPLIAKALELITGRATKAPALKMPAGVELIPHMGEDVTRGGMKSIVNL